MLSVLSGVIYALIVIIAVLLIVLILVQPSKGGGFGSAFGGVGESVFGAHAMSHLSKLTVVLITIFFILTLVLAVITGHLNTQDDSVVINSQAEESVTAEASADVKATADEEKAPVAAVEEKATADEEKAPVADAKASASADSSVVEKK